MKKFLSILMSAIFLSAFSACSKTETSSEAVSEIYEGNGYTIEIDSSKWMDVTEYIDTIAEMAEGHDAAKNLNITAEDLKGMSDAMYYYKDDNSVNFNIMVSEIGDVGEIDKDMLEQLAVAMESQYEAMTGYSYQGYEVLEANGNPALKVNLSTDAQVYGEELKMSVYMIFNGTKQYGFTYTAKTDSYDKVFPEFEAIVNSVSFE
ncbi:MAG: hypothetical protein J6K17_02045 [Oscillospiraceae bacterium]|nr:hypothetical protein [Oscillospiraceae bacterium]